MRSGRVAVLSMVALAACVAGCGTQQDAAVDPGADVTIAVADVGDQRPGVTDAVRSFASLLGLGSPQACALMTADLQASFAAAAPTCAAAVERLARSGLDLRLPEIAGADPDAVEIAGDRASLVIGTSDAGAGGETETWSLRRAGGGTWLLEHVPFTVS